MTNTAQYALGMDIGGTKIAAGVVKFPAGEVILERVISTQPTRSGVEILHETAVVADGLAQIAGTRGIRIGSVGIGVPELVDSRGCITSDQTIPWRGVPVAGAFSRLGPVVVESDVRAAALGEAILGAGGVFQIFAYITVGTGISSCLVQHQVPFAGARGNALVLATAALSATCPGCGEVVNEVLEEIASGPALVHRYNQRVGYGATKSGEDVFARATSGDTVAIEIVRRGGRALGNSVAFLVNILDPEAVIVGGGLALAGGLYWASFEASTREHIWSSGTRDLPILPAGLGAHAGLIGAAATAWRSQGGRGI